MELSATSEVRRPWWTLTLLVFLLIMSLMDRIILSLLVQPLRDTFQISDVQFGLLFGTSFAILYGFLGFPAARLADTKNRMRLVFCGAILLAHGRQPCRERVCRYGEIWVVVVLL